MMMMMVVVDVMMVTVTVVRRMRDDRMDRSANANGGCGGALLRFISGVRRAMLEEVVASIDQRRSDHGVHLFRRPKTQRRPPLARTTLGRRGRMCSRSE